MDVRVEAAAMTAAVEMGEPTALVSILAIPTVLAGLPSVVASTRIRSMGRSSLTAIPNPASIGGATLANAA